MRGVGLANHRIAGSDGSGKIPAGNTVERQRKIVGAEDGHPPGQRTVHGADAGAGVDRRKTPGPISSRGSPLPQLVGRARQLDTVQPGLCRQTTFGVGHRHDLIAAGFYTIGILFQKLCNCRRVDGQQLFGSGGGRLYRRLHVRFAADRINLTGRFSCSRIFGLEGALLVGLAPLAVDQYRFCF